MGDVLAAVDRYADIPAATRQALQARMLAHQYDDIAEIRRDTITGTQTYSDLRDMHFGEGRLCRLPSRALWSAQHTELGLVYCEQEHCLIVPTVCRNVSRVTRTGVPPGVPPALPPVEVPGGTGGLSFTSLLIEDPRRWPQDARIVPPAKPIPEPSTLALLALGLGLVGFARWLKETR